MLALVKEYIISLWEVKLNHALSSLSLSPQLGIRGMALWLEGREEVSLVSSVTQGELTGKLSLTGDFTGTFI